MDEEFLSGLPAEGWLTSASKLTEEFKFDGKWTTTDLSGKHPKCEWVSEMLKNQKGHMAKMRPKPKNCGKKHKMDTP